MLCSWCDDDASWVLVADADLHNHDHPACEPHRAAWVHLYRRAVAVPDAVVVDLRDLPADAALDLRAADDPVGRHER